MLLLTSILLFATTLVFDVNGLIPHPWTDQKNWLCTKHISTYTVKEFTTKALRKELERLEVKIKSDLKPDEELFISGNGLQRVYQLRGPSGGVEQLWDTVPVSQIFVAPDATIPGIRSRNETCRFEARGDTFIYWMQHKLELIKQRKLEREMREKVKAIEPAPQGTVKSASKAKGGDKTLTMFGICIQLSCIVLCIAILCYRTILMVQKHPTYKEKSRTREETTENEENSAHDSDSGEETAVELLSEDDTQCETESDDDDSSDDSFEMI